MIDLVQLNLIVITVLNIKLSGWGNETIGQALATSMRTRVEISRIHVRRRGSMHL